MFTKKEHIRALAKNLLLRLEQDEALVMVPQEKLECFSALYEVMIKSILTDEDLREKTIQKLGLTADALSEVEASESDQFRTAKSTLMNQYAENAVRGLYYQITIKALSEEIKKFLMRRPEIDEVFWDDSQLEKRIVDFIKQFDPAQLH